MRLRDHGYPFFRALIVWTLVAHLLLVVAAATKPGLHQWMHSDAGAADHQCAITLFASGAWNDLFAQVIARAADLTPGPIELPVEAPRIPSSFCISGILEHAPPRRA